MWLIIKQIWLFYSYLAIIDELWKSNLSIQLFMYEIPIHLKKAVHLYSTQIANLRAHTTKHEVGQLWHQAQAFTGTTGKIGKVVAVSGAVALAGQLTGNILTMFFFFFFFFLQII